MYIAPKEVPFFADIPSQDHSTLFPFENLLPTQPPQEDLYSDPYLQIPSIWDFQGNGNNDFSTIVPSVGTLFSSDLICPEVDLIEKGARRKQIEKTPSLWNFQGNGDNFSIIVPSVGTLLSSDLAPAEVDPIEKEKEAKRKQIEVLLAELQSLDAKP